MIGRAEFSSYLKHSSAALPITQNQSARTSVDQRQMKSRPSDTRLPEDSKKANAFVANISVSLHQATKLLSATAAKRPRRRTVLALAFASLALCAAVALRIRIDQTPLFGSPNERDLVHIRLTDREQSTTECQRQCGATITSWTYDFAGLDAQRFREEPAHRFRNQSEDRGRRSVGPQLVGWRPESGRNRACECVSRATKSDLPCASHFGTIRQR